MTTAQHAEITPLEPQTLPGIVVTVLTAVGAGAGAILFLACASGFWWLPRVWWLLLLGGMIVGALLAIRFTRDDRHVALRIANLVIDVSDAEAEITRLEEMLRTTHGLLIESKQEVGRLELIIKTSHMHYVEPESTLDPVRVDAETLIDTWVRKGHQPPTQREMVADGWSPARYGVALAYLAARGIVDRNTTRPAWLVDSRADAIALIGIDRISNPILE